MTEFEQKQSDKKAAEGGRDLSGLKPEEPRKPLEAEIEADHPTRTEYGESALPEEEAF